MSDTTLEFVKKLASELDEKKAMQIQIIDVSKISSITDYFILASGNSQPHLRALGNTVEMFLKENKLKVMGTESGDDTGWVAVDAFSFMVHLFTPDVRDNYSLDMLWKDGETVKAM